MHCSDFIQKSDTVEIVFHIIITVVAFHSLQSMKREQFLFIQKIQFNCHQCFLRKEQPVEIQEVNVIFVLNSYSTTSGFWGPAWQYSIKFK